MCGAFDFPPSLQSWRRGQKANSLRVETLGFWGKNNRERSRGDYGKEGEIGVCGGSGGSVSLPVSREQKRAGVSRSETAAQTATFSAKQTAVLSKTRKLLAQGERGSTEKQNPDYAEGILI